FIPVNCGAIPETIIESELFGHEKGAFTGAVDKHRGFFELADGGTIFLDEVSELTQQAQVKLLRVLENKEFFRVGGTSTVRSDFRLIAATNRDLKEAVLSGNFRKDLYFRLSGATIYIPPLRERQKDIPVLAYKFLQDL
ncbi:MAG: sigma 54-interacting transcriptional regulator, partial [bacterium]